MSPRRLSLTVNDRPVIAEVEPRMHLADFLRERLLLTGTHLGCEHGICGACTVWLDGQIARSCITYAVACDGAEVRSIEGFDDDPVMERLRRAFSAEHALQCGYCTPGMLIAARDIVLRLPDADARRIRTELSGNLCRCTGYVGIVRAVQRVLEERRAAGEAAPAAAPPVAEPSAAPRPAAVPRRPVPPATPPAASERPPPSGREGMTRLSQSFVVRHPPAKVWAFFDDLAAVAGCMPGAELTAVEDDGVSGRLTVRLGPMAAAFAGDATLRRDPAERSGTIEGSGSDRRSASRARGRVEYRLSEADGGAATRVEVEVAYALAGPLAQFGRGGIVNDLAARLTADFARNLESRLDAGPDGGAAEAAAAPQALNAGALLLSVLRARIGAFFARLFRRR